MNKMPKKGKSTKGNNSPFKYTSKIDGSTTSYSPKEDADIESKPSALGNTLHDLIKARDGEPRSSVLGNALDDLVEHKDIESKPSVGNALNDLIKGRDIVRRTSALDDSLNDLLDTRGNKDTSEKYPDNIQVFKDEDDNDRYFSTDEFIIQFDRNVSDDVARKTLHDLGSSVIEGSKRLKGLYIAKKPGDKELFDVIQEFNKVETVVFCEPSEYGKDDRLSLASASYDISDLKRFWALQRIEAGDAWMDEIGKDHVVISIIDTGVNLGHDDLKPNLLERGDEDWDFIDDDLDPEDEDEHDYHGTFIAGIAAAAHSKPEGMIGVCPKAKIMPLRVQLAPTWKNDLNKYFDRFEAINFVAEKAKMDKKRRYILSCSWKISGDVKYILYAIRQAIENGVLVIFAAGNDNRNLKNSPLYPAVYPEVLAVAATDQNDRKLNISNYGPGVDVCAPGDNVWSTVGNNGYNLNSGTSFAVPYVAGLAALLWSIDPGLSNHDVRKIIEDTCDEIDDRRYKGLLGHGRINVKRAVRYALKKI